MKKVIVATNNEGKLKEIKDILKDYQLLSLKDINCKVEVEEDKDTFEGNSLKKAQEISEILHMPCIADDSGLCIDIYDGWPGVHTARFLGENATAKERNQYILEKNQILQNIHRLNLKIMENVIVTHQIIKWTLNYLKAQQDFMLQKNLLVKYRNSVMV